MVVIGGKLCGARTGVGGEPMQGGRPSGPGMRNPTMNPRNWVRCHGITAIEAVRHTPESVKWLLGIQM
jgi:hypothetical protein